MGSVILLGTKKGKILKYFPFITAVLIWITIFIFTFIGSGFELNTTNLKIPYSFISFLIHGSNEHINGNLIYFTTVSVLSELFIKIRGKSFKKDWIIWFFCPLVFPSFLAIRNLISYGEFSFGLSSSIESMTWFLWMYIIANFKEVIKNKRHVLMAILSGIPSYVFFGWLIAFLFGYFNSDPYNQNLAVGHAIYGVVTLIIALILYFCFSRKEKFNIISMGVNKATQIR